MSLHFPCSSCQTMLSTSTEQPGSIVSYRRCQKKMEVPPVSPPVALPVPQQQVVPAVMSVPGRPTFLETGSVPLLRYPGGTDEKCWVNRVLARKNGLGF